MTGAAFWESTFSEGCTLLSLTLTLLLSDLQLNKGHVSLFLKGVGKVMYVEDKVFLNILISH